MGEKNNDTLKSELQVLLNKAAKVMLGLPRRSSSSEALKRLDLKPFSTRRFFPPLYFNPQMPNWND